MRIGLINEGTYPVVTGGVSTWCHRLIGELDEHEFHVVTLAGQERTACWEPLGNLASVTVVPMWDAPARPRRSRETSARQRAAVSSALAMLWRAVLAEGDEPDLVQLRSAVRQLSEVGEALPLLLDRITSTRALLDAWQRHAATRPQLPVLSASTAATVARTADRSLAVLGCAWPEVDVINATTNGTACLLALVRQWRDGTPVILSEHGVFLRERYLALAGAEWPWTDRYVMMAFTRAVCQLVYAECASFAPVSEFNARWETNLGAARDKISVIPNAIEPDEFPAIADEPDVPTVTFVGRIDPLKDLASLIRAFAIVHESLPAARLRLFGPTPAGNESYQGELVALVDTLGLCDVVTFEGPTKGPQPALQAGHVVALSSISEGLPFSVIEAMMSGRATVSTDVGGVAECTGRDGVAGIVVPARDPEALAGALAWLLRDHDSRRAMGQAARQRALQLFTIAEFTQRYRRLYERVARAAGSESTLSDDAPAGRRTMEEISR